jgi:hypothetical protein
MSREVPDTVRLYLGGKIDQWYLRQDGKGVVFILNLSSAEEAHSMLEALPLGQAKLMTFELIPLGPLSPLGLLLSHPDKPAQWPCTQRSRLIARLQSQKPEPLLPTKPTRAFKGAP